jgi:hypothetical protein
MNQGETRNRHRFILPHLDISEFPGSIIKPLIHRCAWINSPSGFFCAFPDFPIYLITDAMIRSRIMRFKKTLIQVLSCQWNPTGLSSGGQARGIT